MSEESKNSPLQEGTPNRPPTLQELQQAQMQALFQLGQAQYQARIAKEVVREREEAAMRLTAQVNETQKKIEGEMKALIDDPKRPLRAVSSEAPLAPEKA